MSCVMAMVMMLLMMMVNNGYGERRWCCTGRRLLCFWREISFWMFLVSKFSLVRRARIPPWSTQRAKSLTSFRHHSPSRHSWPQPHPCIIRCHGSYNNIITDHRPPSSPWTFLPYHWHRVVLNYVSFVRFWYRSDWKESEHWTRNSVLVISSIIWSIDRDY